PRGAAGRQHLREAPRAIGLPSFARDPLRDVVRPLAGAELDDAEVREAVLVEGILADDPLDLLPALADRQDDAAVARNLAARHEKIAGGVVFLQEPDVRLHVRIDLTQVRLVGELDDEHGDFDATRSDLPARSHSV